MNMKRMRGRNHRPNGGGGGGGFRNQQNGIPLNRNHVFDSSGPEMRVRGTAQQLFEKYTQMARDASSNGDRVTGEACYQHAEHYFRIISAINQAQGQPAQSGQSAPYPQNQGNGEYRNGGQAEDAPREEYRPNEQRQNEQRPNEQRQNEQRPYEPRQERRFEPRQDRQYDRNNDQRGYERKEFERKSEFTARPRTENGFRNEPSIDHRIDISSALEAELAAAAPAGYGEQPSLPISEQPSRPISEQPALPVTARSALAVAEPAEARAIPIIPDAPPPAQATTDAPVRTPRPRGRPRLVKDAPAADQAADKDPG